MESSNNTVPHSDSTRQDQAIQLVTQYLERINQATQYPVSVLKQTSQIIPILPSSMWSPLIFDYTDPIFSELPIRDTVFMQEWTMKTLEEAGKKWWIAGYLEDRSRRLRGTHLIEEWRVYHLGIDIIAPANTSILSPIDGQVIESTIESWKASYGWYVITQYTIAWENIYVLYGHLDPSTLTPIGTIEAGQKVGNIWAPEVNGGWTTHLHMQALTEEWLKTWKNKWYCSLADLPTIRNYCPDPGFLIRY